MLTGPQNMPIFNDKVMSPQDKKDIISYLLQTRTGANHGGPDLGSLGPVSEGLFVWTIVLGLLLVFAVWIGAHTTKASRARVATSRRPRGRTPPTMTDRDMETDHLPENTGGAGHGTLTKDAVAEDPFQDPGLPAYRPRVTDIDARRPPSAPSARSPCCS